MNAPVTAFIGRYRFLSNFYPAAVTYDGVEYTSVEHAFQAAKTTSVKHRAEVQRAPTTAAAKRLGRRVPLREGWDSVRVDVMRDLLRLKFAHADLRAKLVATGDVLLVEGNVWRDVFWGQCPVGVGENWLGRLLMQVREECR